jgi:hypothetical protein
MTRRSRRRLASAWTRAALLLFVGAVTACTSAPVKIGPRPPANPTLLGSSRGSSCGVLFFNLLPVGVNDRVDKAYKEAQVAIGGRDVTDTRVTERWYSIPLLATVLCTDVEETAVQ